MHCWSPLLYTFKDHLSLSLLNLFIIHMPKLKLGWCNWPFNFLTTPHLTLELLYIAHHLSINNQDSSKIGEFSHVIWSWKYGKHFSLIEKFIAFLHHLMWATDEVKAMICQKPIDNFFPIRKSNSSIDICIPYITDFRRIRPKHITNQPILLKQDGPLDLVDLCHLFQQGTWPTMHTEDPPTNDSSNG